MLSDTRPRCMLSSPPQFSPGIRPPLQTSRKHVYRHERVVHPCFPAAIPTMHADLNLSTLTFWFLTFAWMAAIPQADTSFLHPSARSGSIVQRPHGLTTLDPYVRMEAEAWDFEYGTSTYPCSSPACTSYIGNINNGDFVAYYAVDFAEGATEIQLSMAADASKNDQIGTLSMHVDNISSNPFARVILGNTGDLEGFVTLAQFLEFPPVGVRDLYFTFATQFGTMDIGNLDWFQFFKVGARGHLPWPNRQPGRDATKDAFARTQAVAWDYQKGIGTSECNDKSQCDFYAGYIQRDDVLGYFGLDFQGGATGLEMALGANVDNGDVIGTIHFHLDNTSSNPFAAVVTGNSDGEQVWVDVKQFIEYAPVGVHDLYFTFSADTSADIGNIAWFQFFRVQ